MVARLGAGNFGAVDIVRHRVTGRTYALKKMVKRMIEKRGIQKYVVNERYILCALPPPPPPHWTSNSRGPPTVQRESAVPSSCVYTARFAPSATCTF